MAEGFLIGGSSTILDSAGSVTLPIYIDDNGESQAVAQAGTNQAINIDISGTAAKSGQLINSVKFKNAAGADVSFNGSSALDLTDGFYYASTAGKISTTTAIGGAKKPIYIAADGTITAFTASEGSSTKPVYLNNGTITVCNDTLGNNISGNAATATKLTSSAGSATKPIYFSDGKPVICNDTLANNISGNAATATKTEASCGNNSKICLVTGSGQTDTFQINYGCGSSDDGYGEICTTDNGTEPIYCRQYSSGTIAHTITLMDANGYSSFIRAYNAVWNDYAEFREGFGEPGQCVCENSKGIVMPSTKRLQKCPNIISDTYGYSMGRATDADVALAVAGRVLAYPDKDKNLFRVGDVVCAGKNGTISKMNKLEIILFPDRIIGIVNEIPSYDEWGQNNVKVNNRIWIKIK